MRARCLQQVDQSLEGMHRRAVLGAGVALTGLVGLASPPALAQVVSSEWEQVWFAAQPEVIRSNRSTDACLERLAGEAAHRPRGGAARYWVYRR